MRVFNWLCDNPGKALLLSFAIAAALLLASAYMEARTYERITGKPVSTWDALWIEFRVQEGVDDR